MANIICPLGLEGRSGVCGMHRLSRRQGGGGQGRESLRGTLEGTVGVQESFLSGLRH